LSSGRSNDLQLLGNGLGTYARPDVVGALSPLVSLPSAWLFQQPFELWLLLYAN